MQRLFYCIRVRGLRFFEIGLGTKFVEFAGQQCETVQDKTPDQRWTLKKNTLSKTKKHVFLDTKSFEISGI